jgi:hypothetical protein
MAKPTSPEQVMALSARLRELFTYNPETGFFIRLIARRGRAPAGSVAGSIYPSGYRYITIDKKDYRAGHLAWLWMTGAWPEAEIDHKDHVKNNNAWLNLRSATPSQNKANRRVMSNNLLGIKGVSFVNGKYHAAVYVNSKAVRLGKFADPDQAAAAVREAGRKYHGEFYHAGDQL